MRSSLRQITLICTLSLFFCFDALIAQDQKKIDSIKLYNSTLKNKVELVENYNKLSYLYGSINIDSSLAYSNKAMGIAKQINFRKGLAVSYSYTARGMIEKGNIKSSLQNFDKALELFKEEKDSLNILDSYRGMSYVASYGSSQLKCLDYNLKALNYAEGLKDTTSMAVIYNNIGSIYKKLDNYNSSLLYFTKSLEIELSKQNTSIRDLAVSYSNIGVLKVESNKVEEAKDEYKNVIQLLPKVKSIYLKPYLQLSISGYYIGIKEFELAKKYIDSATSICEENDFKQIKSRAYRKKAEWYFYQNFYKESIEYFNKCLDYSKSIHVYEEFPEIYKKRAEAYSKLGQFKKSFYSLEKANTFIDSLKNNSVSSFLSDFEDQKRKSEIEKHKIEKALKNQQLENASIKKKVLLARSVITILVLLFVVGIILYYFLKVRKRNKELHQQHKTISEQKNLLVKNIHELEIKEENLRKLNATKDKFFSIIAHDLKNPFNAILGFSKILLENFDSFNDKKRLALLSEVKKSSESTLNLLENLLNWARSQRGSIQIKKEKYNLKKLVENSIDPYLGASLIKEVVVINTIDSKTNLFADKETMTVVFSNLFVNAVKFSNQGSSVLINSKITDKNVEICFQDYGIGMDNEIMDGLFKVEKNVKRKGTLDEKGTGLGLILCKEFVEKNNGKIWVESEEGKGSKFFVSLPK